jgi:hypothetical protein
MRSGDLPIPEPEKPKEISLEKLKFRGGRECRRRIRGERASKGVLR